MKASMYNSGPVVTDAIRSDIRTGLASVENTTSHQVCRQHFFDWNSKCHQWIYISPKERLLGL